MTRYFRYFIAFAVTLFGLVGTARPAAAWEQGVIWDLKVVYGTEDNVGCGPGWYRIDQDLNEGAGGLYAYLCVTYDKGTHLEPIAGVYVCDGGCPAGYSFVLTSNGVPADLNAGRPSPGLFLGYYRGQITPVREILFSVTTEDSSKESCAYAGRRAEPDTLDVWEPIPGVQDLNKGIGGSYIYPCVRYMAGGTRDNTETVFDFVVHKHSSGEPDNCWQEDYTVAGVDLNDGAYMDGIKKTPCLLRRGPDQADWDDYPHLVRFGGPLTMLFTVAKNRGSTTPMEGPCAAIGGTLEDVGAFQEGPFKTDRLIYFCTSRVHWPHEQNRAITDIRIVSIDDRPDDPWAVCGQQLGSDWHAVPSLNEPGVNDLNAGAGGKFIYACVKVGPAYREGVLDGPTFNVATGDVIQVDAQWMDANGHVGRWNVKVSALVQATDSIDGDLPVTCDRDNEDFIRVEAYLIGRVPNPVWCTATDSHGNLSRVMIDLEVVDRPPTMLDMPRLLRGIEAGPDRTRIQTFEARAFDTVDGYLNAVCTPASGSVFPVGDTDVHCKATDRSGLSTEGIITVRVWEPQPPLINWHEDLTVDAGPGGKATVWFEVTGVHSNNHGFVVPCSPPSMSEFPLGTTTVQCSASDSLGNTATKSFRITVVDRNPPALNVPADVTVEATGPTLTTLSQDVLGSASASEAETSATVTRSPSGFQFPIGTTEITWTATDTSGNATTAIQKVTVADTTAPVIASVSNLVFEATSANGVTLTAAQLPNPSATDAVGATNFTRQPAGFDFPLGTTTIAWSVADAAGNIGTATQTIIVRDTTPPVVTVTSDPIYPVGATSRDGAIVKYPIDAKDAVDGILEATCSIPWGTMAPMGESLVTCTATDRSGNSATKTFVIIVEDREGPVMTAPAEVVLEATGLLTPVSFGVTALDAIDGPVEVRCLPALGTGLPIGTTIVRCGANDAAGNFANHSRTTVVVRDTTAPILVAGAPIVVEATSAAGATIAPTALQLLSSSDAIGVVTISRSPAGVDFPIGSTTVTWTATDAAGNSATATQDVIVRDTTAPVLSLPAPITLDATSANGAPVQYQASAADIVDGAVMASCSPAPGSTFPIGVTTVSCIARDAHGTTASGSFTVTVNQLTAEQLIANLDESIEVKQLDKRVQQILRSIDGQRDARACAQIAQLREAIAKDRKLSAADQQELLAQVDWLGAVAGCR